jgi:hypothetical protein
MAAAGFDGTNWVADRNPSNLPTISITPSQTWTTTANGTRMLVRQQPTNTIIASGISGGTTPTITIDHSPETGTYRANAWSFQTAASAVQATLDVAGNLTTTGSLNAKSGLTYNMFTTGATTGATGENVLNLIKSDATGAANQGLINFTTQRSSAGVYSATQSGDSIGQFKFNGNAWTTATLANVQITGTAGQFTCNSTSLGVNEFITVSGTLSGTGTITGYSNPTTYKISATNGSTTFTLVTSANAAIVTTAGTTTGLTFTPQPGVSSSAAGSVTVKAAEAWTPTANGSVLEFGVIKNGSINQTTVISASPTQITTKGDTTTLQDSAGSSYLTLNSTSATFTQPVGFPVKTATQWNAITGQVGRQVCVSDSPVNAGKMAYWDTTNSRWSYIDTNTAV